MFCTEGAIRSAGAVRPAVRPGPHGTGSPGPHPKVHGGFRRRFRSCARRPVSRRHLVDRSRGDDLPGLAQGAGAGRTRRHQRATGRHHGGGAVAGAARRLAAEAREPRAVAPALRLAAPSALPQSGFRRSSGFGGIVEIAGSMRARGPHRPRQRFWIIRSRCVEIATASQPHGVRASRPCGAEDAAVAASGGRALPANREADKAAPGPHRVSGDVGQGQGSRRGWDAESGVRC